MFQDPLARREFSVRLPAVLVEAIDRWAKEDHRTRNEQIGWILQQYAARRGAQDSVDAIDRLACEQAEEGKGQ